MSSKALQTDYTKTSDLHLHAQRELSVSISLKL